MASKKEQEFSLSIGETYKIGRYTLELNNLKEDINDNYGALIATVSAYNLKSKKLYTTLEPELRRYFRNQESNNRSLL